MSFFLGANEYVIVDVTQSKQLTEHVRLLVRELLGRHALRLSHLLDLESMFVGAGHEEGFSPLEPEEVGDCLS